MIVLSNYTENPSPLSGAFNTLWRAPYADDGLNNSGRPCVATQDMGFLTTLRLSLQ